MSSLNFDTICEKKDAEPSNLSELFDTYGCSLLEAKVPVVERPVVEELKNVESKEQIIGTLGLKAESASWAMKGRAPRTRNKELRVVEVNGEVILEAGQERERSPVDRGELDDELESYARERARIKAMRMGVEVPEFEEPPLVSRQRVKKEIKREIMGGDEENWDEEPEKQQEQEPDEAELDEDLERYMREAARMRAQKRHLAEQTDRMDAMKRMEDEDF